MKRFEPSPSQHCLQCCVDVLPLIQDLLKAYSLTNTEVAVFNMKYFLHNQSVLNTLFKCKKHRSLYTNAATMHSYCSHQSLVVNLHKIQEKHNEAHKNRLKISLFLQKKKKYSIMEEKDKKGLCTPRNLLFFNPAGLSAVSGFCCFFCGFLFCCWFLFFYFFYFFM